MGVWWALGVLYAPFDHGPCVTLAAKNKIKIQAKIRIDQMAMAMAMVDGR